MPKQTKTLTELATALLEDARRQEAEEAARAEAARQAAEMPPPIRAEMLPDLLTEREAATYLRLAPKTLRNWRSEKKGPKFLHLGARVLYPRTAILAFGTEEAAA